MNEELMNRTLKIKRKTRIAAGQGAFKSAYVEIGSTDAFIEQTASPRTMKYDKEEFPVTHEIVTPYQPDIKAGDILQEGEAREFLLLSVENPGELDDHLEMYASERI